MIKKEIRRILVVSNVVLLKILAKVLSILSIVCVGGVFDVYVLPAVAFVEYILSWLVKGFRVGFGDNSAVSLSFLAFLLLALLLDLCIVD